jgi:hypothetical protein
LANIFQTTIKQTSEGDGSPARVDNEPSTSNDTTAPRVVRLAPRIHQRQTRRNTPVLQPIDENIKPRTNPSKTTKRFDVRMERRMKRAEARESDDQAIKQVIKKNLQDINTTRLKQIIEEQRKVIIEPVNTPKVPEVTSHEKNRPIPITQECDSVIEDVHKTSYQAKTTDIRVLAPKFFAPHALHHVVGRHIESYTPSFVPKGFDTNIGNINLQIPLEEVAGAGVVNPETGETLTKYEQLLKVPALKQTWSAAMCKELGRLATGWENEAGTETIEFMLIDEIKEIPKDRTVTYARIVVDYRPQKKDPNRVQWIGQNIRK